ncbi:MAG: hypothetical protein ACRD1N_00900 [Terriglobia bacterium]
MIPEIPWQAAAKPAAAWLLRRLPGFILRKRYNAEALEADIKLRLLAESGATLKRPRELVAPSIEFQGEAFNMSAYLDVSVTAVRSFLSSPPEKRGNVFAECDDWSGFRLPRGSSRPFVVTYWLNQFQMTLVSSCSDDLSFLMY